MVGGGLAGISAALRCSDAGLGVTLLEVRPRLGGAVYSVRRDGLTMDNGQHVFLRCCEAYRGLLQRIGSEGRVRLQSRLEIPLLRPGGKPSVLRRNGLPAPLHLAGALLRFQAITLRQRLRAASAMRALSRLDPADPEVDATAMGPWLQRHGQDEEVVRRLWDLLVLPTVNVRAKEASLALSAFVFQQGLLSSPEAGDIGFHAYPLSETVGEPALRALRRAGVDVRLGWRASGIGERSQSPERPFEVLGSFEGRQEALPADAVILALPHLRAASLLPQAAGDLRRSIESIGVSPIVNLHVLYDRRVLDEPFAAGIDTPVQYLFDRTVAGGAPTGAQYVAVSLSGADEEMSMSLEQLRERYEPELSRLLPKAREANIERFELTREHAATFRASPGVGRLRPGPKTPVPGLLLAGSWTDTGWPATMEGAVLSGEAAADEAVRAIGDGRSR